MARLGELEQAVMDVLWRQDRPMTVRDASDALDRDDLAYTTVMTVLDRFARKGFVRREREGRAWAYWPAASREIYITLGGREAVSRRRLRRWSRRGYLPW